jgi:hypothetical protein
MKYDFERLDKYCKENNITLLEDYSGCNVTNQTYIKSNCLNCVNIVYKKCIPFLDTGSYCRKCILNEKKKIDNPEYKTKYGFETLKQFCQEKNITLLEDYSVVNLNQKSRIQGKCHNSNCNNIFNTSLNNLYKRNGFCNLCSKQNRIINQKQTFFTKYGVYNPNKLQEVRNKVYETNIKKYGHKYSFNSEFVKNKIKSTMIEKYGVENAQQNINIKEKTKQTCFDKYGVDYVFSAESVKNKIKNTCLEKYGTEYPSQNIKIKEKVISTNLKNWGVKNPTQNPTIAEKASQNSYQTKIYEMPSGKKIKYQGYENLALNELILNNINEDDILNSKTDVPEIWYFDGDLKRRHYVDIYIKSQNKCIEVKSEWYYNSTKDIIVKKQKAGKELGYKYEIWVYDKKGNKICYE